MASTNPAPSKAALNALRGVLLTTSCSVILLAEERRRRIKLACAAIDNARKLHTVRSNRGPIALVEGLGSWESRLSELGDEVLIPQSKNRRRRRDLQSGEFLSDPSQRRQNISSHVGAPNRHDAATQSNACPVAHPLELSFDSLRLIPSVAQVQQRELLSHNPALRRSSIFARNKEEARGQPTPGKLSNSTAQESMTPNQPAQLSSLPTVDDPDVPIESSHNAENDATHIPSLVPALSPPKATSANMLFEKNLAKLEFLLNKLDSNQASRVSSSENLTQAIITIEKLASSPSPTFKMAKQLRLTGVRLLKSTVLLDSTKTNEVLSILLSNSKDIFQILVPFISWLEEKKFSKSLEQFLTFISDRKNSRYWMRGMFIYRALGRHSKVYEDFQHTKHLYQMLQSAGLYVGITVPQDVEYKIRRQMTMLGAEAGDDVFIHREMQSLYGIESRATKFDVKLQSRLLVREANLGKWDFVRNSIESLGEGADMKSPDFQCMLIKITDIFAENHSAEELEALLRQFVGGYGISLKYRWVNHVLDRHASRHRLDSMLSWLQFCGENGPQMDDNFIQAFYSRCRKFWSFSDGNITHLDRKVQASLSSVPLTSLKQHKSSRISVTGKHHNRHRHALPPADEESAVQGIEAQEAHWTTEVEAFKCMELLAGQNEWQRVCRAYDELSSSNLGFSARCLRLAVLGQIKQQDGSPEHAASLVELAYAQGHEVTEALTPLLLARLERGDDAISLINEALRRGIRIHDSVYNKASQCLSAKCDLRGATSICEIAARENGNGELLYNEYNFSNLIFAYTGTARYQALESTLSKFTAEVQWWRGSKTCKESIKLAMKTTAMRAVVHPRDIKNHGEALKRLDEALTHVKKCRSTKEDRRAVAEAFVRVVRHPGKVAKISPDEVGSISTAAVEKLSAIQTAPTKVFRKMNVESTNMASRRGLAIAQEG